VDGAAYGCEVLFDEERGLAVQELVEAATGEPCPCKQGRACPLLDLKIQPAQAVA